MSSLETDVIDISDDNVEEHTDAVGEEKCVRYLKDSKQRETQLKIPQNLMEGLTFLGGFDPENSRRKKIKVRRKISALAKLTVFDGKGIYRNTHFNVCDCLKCNCPGCFWPCPYCKSTKCGPVCRVNRKFAYQSISYDGSKDEILNDYYYPKK